MKTIYKYAIQPEIDSFEMPVGAQVLTVQTKDNKPFIWAMVDPSEKADLRRFVPYGTGHLMPDDPGVYVGTFQLNGGALVFHLFEQPIFPKD
jgi:hypothetical protein